MKIFIVCSSTAQSGKSTFSKNLSEATGLKAGETSSIIYKELAKELNASLDTLLKVQKELIRHELIEKGNKLQELHPAFCSVRLIEEGCRIITGIRRQMEVDWLKSHYDVVMIWIGNTTNCKDNTQITSIPDYYLPPIPTWEDETRVLIQKIVADHLQ